MKSLKRQIGKTVLYKAKNIEKKYGITDFYLKMEGVNPTGRLQDRFAYALVKEAKDLGFKTVCVASLGPLGTSLAFVCEVFKMDCKIFVPVNSIERKNKWYQMPHVELIEYGKKYSDAYQEASRMALNHNWYDANPGYDNTGIANVVYGEIAEEIVNKLGKNPDNIFVDIGDGALLTGIHLGFRRLWLKGEIDRIPKIFAGMREDSQKRSTIFTDSKIELSNFRNGKINRKIVSSTIFDPQEVLNCLSDSGGEVILEDGERINQGIKEISGLEKIRIRKKGSIAYNSFKIALEKKKILPDEINVVILEEGKAKIDVEELTLDDVENVDVIVEYVMKFLGEYGDNYEETKEAVEYAFKSGFVIAAFFEDRLAGIAIVVKMPLDKVLPPYHLVYIGSDLRRGSRGIGSLLIKKITELTGGKFSLHVDLKNNKAIKVYEKMGLKKSYIRMIYS